MRAVEILRQHVLRCVPRLDRRIVVGLFQCVRAVVRSSSLTLTAVGRALPRAVLAKHRIKAVDRLFGNPRLHGQLLALYVAMATLLLKTKQKRLIVVVDWTQCGANHYALSAAVPFGGRAFPILNHVHPKRHLATRKAHRAFLKALSIVVPPGLTVVLLTDAGFEATWSEDVMAMGWDHVSRLRHRTCVRPSRDVAWRPNKSLHALATLRPTDLGGWQIRREGPVERRLILAARPRKGRVARGRRGRRLRSTEAKKQSAQANEPWLLSTSLREETAREIVRLYAMRMQIEETFRDVKNPRFGWAMSHARSSDPKRLEVLILIAALALAVVTLVGLAAEAEGLDRTLQANTTRNRRVLSLYVVGRLVLQDDELRRRTASKLQGALTVFRRRLAS